MTRVDEVRALFERAYGGAPSGVWSAPGRVNLIGEHTDYTGGFVMPLAIRQRAYVAARPRPERRVRAVAHERDVEEIPLADVRRGHPQGLLSYLAGAAWVAESEGMETGGWDLALISDVPIGAGLSSSAAITCATLLAMNDVAGWERERSELARWGQRVENDVVDMPCGIMDQSASLRCQAGEVLFMDTRSGDIAQVPWPEEHDAVLLVTNTNAPHVLADGQYAERRRLCEEATAILGVSSLRDATDADVTAKAAALSSDQLACARHVVTENARVLAVRELLEGGRLPDIGPILTASHLSLRDDFRVTVPPLDVSVDTALANGAWGARMTGGGFGGCTIALVPATDAGRITTAIDAAFADAGFRRPEHFLATPSAGAHRE